MCMGVDDSIPGSLGGQANKMIEDIMQSWDCFPFTSLSITFTSSSVRTNLSILVSCAMLEPVVNSRISSYIPCFEPEPGYLLRLRPQRCSSYCLGRS